VFSLNETVGKRTQARGYRTATVFVDAEKVPGIGGGVSQITGTLFNAAARAGLPIKEVNPHSRPVAYLPIGLDATVAYGVSDLKFANNTKAPVYIAYSFDNRRLRATIYGAKVAGRRVSLRPAVQKLGPGKINAQLYRVIKDNGKVVAKERLFTHQYRWDPKPK
jgi:vancomycin resistance protein YoaR